LGHPIVKREVSEAMMLLRRQDQDYDYDMEGYGGDVACGMLKKTFYAKPLVLCL
jgi:hypothetical protein